MFDTVSLRSCIPEHFSVIETDNNEFDINIVLFFKNVLFFFVLFFLVGREYLKFIKPNQSYGKSHKH